MKQEQIVKTLKCLKDEGVRFIVLRDPQLRESADLDITGDLDLIIHHEDLHAVIGFFCHHDYFSTRQLNHYNISSLTEPGFSFDIQFGNVRENNIPVLSYEDLKDSVVDIFEIPFLSDSGLLVHLVSHCILNKGKFKQEYRTHIQQLLSVSGSVDVLKKYLHRIFPVAKADYILNALAADEFDSLSGRLETMTFLHICKKPINMFALIKYILWKIMPEYPFRGRVIAFIGLDGTGKTTLANAVVARLQKLGVSAEYLYMGRKRGHALPMHKISQKIGVSKLEAKNKEPGAIYKISRDAAYFMDMFLRYALTITPLIARNKHVICDRYAYSLYLDRRQTFLSRFLLRWFYPKPYALYFIETDEEEIISRKNEYSHEERQFLYGRWMHVVKIFDACIIHTCDIESMTTEVCARILNDNKLRNIKDVHT